MQLTMATVTIHGSLDKKLTAIGDAGFSGVEIFATELEPAGHDPATVGRMAADAGLAVTTFMPFREFEGLPEPLRTKAFDRAERAFDIMQALGTGLLLVCTNVSPDAQPGTARAVDDFRELGERAAARGVRIGVEPLAWGRYISDYRDGWDIIRRVDHPNVGIVLDTFHVLGLDLPVDAIREIPGEKIFDIQITDMTPRLDRDLMTWSRHHRCLPGRGAYDLVPFVRAVEATGYDGVMSLEIFDDGAVTETPQRIAEEGLRSLRGLLAD
ncbi:MAG: sugar phosphate isomerase/epimerase family protein [Alphaproteobacteria bacterium]